MPRGSADQSPGKGVFVAQLDVVKVQETQKKLLLEQLEDIKNYADSIGISKDELAEMLKGLYR